MRNIILKKNIFDEILINPSKECDTLYIISGFATPTMVVHHFDVLKNQYNVENIKIKLTVGMTPLGIPKAHHINFVNLMNNMKNSFECSYINSQFEPIHSKLYVWVANDVPKYSFISSANYTLRGFKKIQEEIGYLCDNESSLNYFKSTIDKSIYCTCPEAELLAKDNINYEIEYKDDDIYKESKQSVKLPLFSERTGDVHTRAGLNWGQRDGREPNQAYIPVPHDIAQSGFFPPRGEQFSVITDDGFGFICVIAQDGDKAIHTTNNNSEFGKYFRNKLGVKLGDKVTIQDLNRYGNKYVTFTKIDEEQYYMEYPHNT